MFKILLFSLSLLLLSWPVESKPKPSVGHIGQNENFIYHCGTWLHVPQHYSTRTERIARIKSGIPPEDDLVIIFYIDCEGELYFVHVKKD